MGNPGGPIFFFLILKNKIVLESVHVGTYTNSSECTVGFDTLQVQKEKTTLKQVWKCYHS